MHFVLQERVLIGYVVVQCYGLICQCQLYHLALPPNPAVQSNSNRPPEPNLKDFHLKLHRNGNNRNLPPLMANRDQNIPFGDP